MHPTEVQLLQLGKQIAVVAQQAAAAYEQAQAALRLDQLFTLDSVATPAGTRRALETVDKLAELHEAHKKMFATSVTAAMQQLTAAVATLPADKARTQEQGLVDALNQQLATQSEFYINRQRWIDAVRAMFAIVEDNRDAITIEDGQMVMHDDEVADRYDAAQQVINDVHQVEVAHMKGRLARAAIGAALLQQLTP